MPEGFLTTHVLDTARGLPAEGVEIDLVRIDADGRHHLATRITNTDGRTDGPILPAEVFATGTYELTFHVGAYLDLLEGVSGHLRFLDQIPIRFAINDANAHYHVPLLLSPYGYSTYRGS